MSYLPLSEKERNEMLSDIGVASFEELVAGIPASLRDFDFTLPQALSEIEVVRAMKALAEKNETTSSVLSFIGGGAYEHFIPSVVGHVLGRTEFYTAYTPYQAEASQGMLQSIYEYQTMMCRLTGLDVSNASHYDGATSMSEAAFLCATLKKRTRIIVSATVNPEYQKVLRTYLAASHLSVEVLPMTDRGEFEYSTLESLIDSDVACVILQTPNFLGIVEDFTRVEKLIHSVGAYFIIVANPLSLARFKTPGEWCADIACGDGQVLGNSLSFGGPYLGFFTTTKEFMRKLPGRLVGMTEDTKGRRAFTLTLQTREQHIRREKATSNICSNQALCALAAAVYMSAMGKEGLKRIADLNMQNAQYLREGISKIKGFELFSDGTHFNEFVVKTKREPSEIIKALKVKKIYAGLDLRAWYPKLGNALFICATETKTKEDLDFYLDQLSRL